MFILGVLLRFGIGGRSCCNALLYMQSCRRIMRLWGSMTLKLWRKTPLALLWLLRDSTCTQKTVTRPWGNYCKAPYVHSKYGPTTPNISGGSYDATKGLSSSAKSSSYPGQDCRGRAVVRDSRLQVCKTCVGSEV